MHTLIYPKIRISKSTLLLKEYQSPKNFSRLCVKIFATKKSIKKFDRFLNSLSKINSNQSQQSHHSQPPC